MYTISSLYPHKNLATLIKAVANLKENYGSMMKLVISGVGGGQEDELNRIINKSQLEGIVVKTGFVSNEEKACLLMNCSLFCFPSIFEGFGMPPVEAILCGIPVLTTEKNINQRSDTRTGCVC